MTSINPFIDNNELHLYKGSVITSGEEYLIDDEIKNKMKKVFDSTSDDNKELINKIIIPKIDSLAEADNFTRSFYIKENEAMEVYSAMNWCIKFGRKHKWGKYGPLFMVKYIEPIIDTRDMNIFAIQFRGLAYNEDMWNNIPSQWKIKDGNTYKIYIRDYMNDGFRNLYQRLLVFEYIVKGYLPK